MSDRLHQNGPWRLGNRDLPVCRSATVLFFSWILTTSMVIAGEFNSLHPKVPKAQGEKCVRSTEFMKKNHMNFLFRRRDMVVIQGIRSKAESFNMCLSCHVVKDKHGTPVSHDSPDHFCRTCHDFVAVKIDCFECHLSVPDLETASGEFK